MKAILTLLLVLVISALQAAQETANLKVLLVTGGHAFEQGPFFKMFDALPGATVTRAEHAKTSAKVYDREDLMTYDVVVLYDMPMVITEKQKAAFLSLFEKGKGVVVLHHALVSFQDWPEYEQIIGGRYPKPPTGQPQVTDAVGYKHDEEVPVTILANDHPITAGLADFTIHDEIYWGFRVGKDVTPILSTSHAKSGKPLAWTREQGNSRLVYLQLGHDHQAWDHPAYPELLVRSIRWVARK